MKYRIDRLVFVLVAAVIAGCSGGGDGLRTNSSGVVGGGGGIGGGGGGGGGGVPGGGGIPGGGGLFSFDTGIGGSGGLIGAIIGFGSVIVNDLEMQTDDAAFFIEGATGSETDLREGQFVIVTGDIGSLDAEEVYYRANLKGPISAPPVLIDPLVGRIELTVLGQTVQVGPATRLYGVTLAELVEGQEVEVSGAVDSAGEVVAGFIEKKTALTEYKAIGVVSALDAAAMQFNLGGLLVSYDGGVVFEEFDGQALADGQLVEVRMDPGQFAAPASATVREIELLPTPQIAEGAELEIEGAIDQFTSAASFTVSGIPIITNPATEYEEGVQGDLAVDVRVEVEGQADATGALVAEKVKFKQDNAVRFEGEVSDITTVDGINGSVLTEVGLTFEVRDSTELEDEVSGTEPFTLNDLVIGDYIEIRGFVNGPGVLAVELERDDPDDRVQLRGPLEGFNQGAGPGGSIVIQGVTILEQEGITDYEDENGNPIATRDDFYTLLGTAEAVSAKWDDYSGAADIADQLSLEDDD